MRLIDADELKEAMEEHTDYKGYLVCDPEEIIDLAPTVDIPHVEWIPCSERLPEKNGVYLVTGENGHVFEYDYSDFTTHNEKWSYCRNEIVAWMPLPDPYREEASK